MLLEDFAPVLTSKEDLGGLIVCLYSFGHFLVSFLWLAHMRYLVIALNTLNPVFMILYSLRTVSYILKSGFGVGLLLFIC